MTTPTDASTFEQIAALVRATQALPADREIRPEQLLFYDLAFSSMDLLDLLFRIEDHFGVAIAEGTLYRLARGDVPDAAFADGSTLTPLGRERLMALLSDTPAAIFPDRIATDGLPRFATVGAIARLVDHLRAQAER
jgi:acyl carrier protein